MIFVFQEFLKRIVTDKEVKGHDLRVLVYLMCEMDYGNEVDIPQRKIAQELKTTQQRVSESIRRLAERNIIHIIRAGRGNKYVINPWPIWKGHINDRQEELKNTSLPH